MAFTKHNFSTGDVLTAAAMNAIEDAIADNEKDIESKASKTTVTALDTKVNGLNNTVSTFNDSINSAVSTASSAKTTADNAKTTADSVYNLASSANDTANEAKTTVDEAKNTAEGAASTAGDAYNLASTVSTIANKADAASQTNTSNIASLTGRMDTAESEIDVLQSDVENIPTEFKTINGESVIGTGEINIAGDGFASFTTKIEQTTMTGITPADGLCRVYSEKVLAIADIRLAIWDISEYPTESYCQELLSDLIVTDNNTSHIFDIQIGDATWDYVDECFHFPVEINGIQYIFKGQNSMSNLSSLNLVITAKGAIDGIEVYKYNPKFIPRESDSLFRKIDHSAEDLENGKMYRLILNTKTAPIITIYGIYTNSYGTFYDVANVATISNVFNQIKTYDFYCNFTGEGTYSLKGKFVANGKEYSFAKSCDNTLTGIAIKISGIIGYPENELFEIYEPLPTYTQVKAYPIYSTSISRNVSVLPFGNSTPDVVLNDGATGIIQNSAGTKYFPLYIAEAYASNTSDTLSCNVTVTKHGTGAGYNLVTVSKISNTNTSSQTLAIQMTGLFLCLNPAD